MYKKNSNIPPKRNNIDGIISGPRRDSLRTRSNQAQTSHSGTEFSRNTAADTLEEARALRHHDAQVVSRRPMKLSRREKRKLGQQSGGIRGEKKLKTPFKKKLKRLFIIVLVLLIASGGYFGVKSFSKLKNIFRGGGSSAVVCGEVAPEELQTEGAGRVNILLLGIGGEKQPDGPNLTDSMIVASINPLDNSASLLSLPRDLWVDTGDGEYSKINEAYQNGLFAYKKENPNNTDEWPAIQRGFAFANRSVEQAIGVPINFTVLLSYTAFEQAIDAVGGVDIIVPEDLIDYSMAWENNGNPVLAEAGTQHMDSVQALMYTRSRYGSDRGDYDRAERQRAMIVALQKKVLSAGTLANPIKVSQLIDALGNNIRSNIGAKERTCLVNIARKVDGGAIKSVELYDLVEGDTIGGQSVQIPKAGNKNFDEIHSFARNQLRDSYIARERAPITVVNASGIEGLGTEQADLLRSFGYHVDDVVTSAQVATTTEIVDISTDESPKYTLHYLQRRLAASVTNKLPQGIERGNAKIVIILGSDATSN